MNSLALDWDERHLWRKQIIAFQKAIQDIVLEKTKSYKKVEVDPEWLKSQRNPRKAFDTRKFVIHLASRGHWEKQKWTKGAIDKQERTLFVCGVEEQKRELETIGKMFSQMHPGKLDMIGDSRLSHLRVGFVAPTNLKYLENVKNLVTVGTFHNSKPFRRAMTAYHVRTLKKYQNVLKIIDAYDEVVWDNVYEPISNLMAEVKSYMDTNGIYKTKEDFRYEPILQSGYELIAEKNLFETDLMDKLNLIDEYITNIPMLSLLLDMKLEDISVNDGIFIDSDYREEVAREIVKAIVMHNSHVPKKQRKKINGYYHIILRTNELEWLSENDREFIKYIQRPKLQYI